MKRQKSTEKEKKHNVKRIKGITLIALVITIVVLLILASVSITVVFGDNGILQLAKEAGEKTNEAVKNDISSIGELEDILHETQTGITVKKVTDANPGELEESEEHTYTINSIEDLVAFAYNVTSGTNNYEGKTVKLGLSLDFNSTKSYVDANSADYAKYGYEGNLKTLLTTGEGFKPIGITTEDNKDKNFAGTFDGKGNFINGLYINIKIDRNNYDVMDKIGLFSKNFGTIQNLKLLNTNIYASEKKAYVAGICGQNMKTGKIENCIVSGNIKSEVETGDVGGITCYSSGTISNSGNFANLSADFKKIPEGAACDVGGLCSGYSMGTMSNCFNRGNIDVTVADGSGEGSLYIGGLIGQCVGDIENCYNICSIKVNNPIKNSKIGGLIGYQWSGVPMQMGHCYSISSLFRDNENGFIGGLVGAITHTFPYSGNYYSSSDEINTIGNRPEEGGECRKIREDMKQESFLELMNTGLEDDIWVKDLNNINDGYPILKWQIEN